MLREARILEEMLECHQIVALDATLLDDENLYFVMEHVQKGPLDKLIKTVKSLPKQTCQYFLADIILGLEALHE